MRLQNSWPIPTFQVSDYSNFVTFQSPGNNLGEVREPLGFLQILKSRNITELGPEEVKVRLPTKSER